MDSNLNKVKLTSDRVLIDIDHNPSELAPGGIIVLPERSRGMGVYVIGTVKATGPGWMPKNKYEESDRVPLEVKPGDKVWVHKASLSTTATINNHVYVLLRENEIIGIVEEVD